jgi:putative nucleotidyltransferase with HDIG domain
MSSTIEAAKRRMRRILFVDDDPAVLEGLRLSLRRKRAVWEMTFVNGGEAALVEIARKSPDMVVADMRMNGMDGATLLGRVAAVAPQAIRIVLSAQMDEDASARAVSVAHRFMTKPCESAALEELIARALELQDRLNSDFLREKLGGLDSVPSLPRSYLALSEAMRDPHVSIDTVSGIIVQDTAMAAKVLQLINSSFFGLPRQIVNIKQAVSYVGLQTMRTLVLVHSTFQKLGVSDLPAMERLQAHALAAARIARKLFPDRQRAERAETAALLHDIGKLMLLSRLPNEYAEIRELARQQGSALSACERARFGVTHAEVGGYVLGLWGLPPDVIEAVANHAAPWCEIMQLDLTAAVQIADWLSVEVFGTGDELLPEHDSQEAEQAIERLGLKTFVAARRREASADG